MFTNLSSRDKSKLCEYHNDHSHNIKDCRLLKWEIVRLLKVGHLKELSHKGKAPIGNGQKEMTPPPKQLRIVNSITRGSKIRGVSVSASAAHIRRVHSIVPRKEMSDG